MKLPSLLLVALIMVTFAGCKQDFDITADYRQIPVVYGLLNYQDNNHYIRIQKGYLIDGDARLASGITDSIYYTADTLKVQLVPYSTSNGNQLGVPVNFTLVDGNTIGLPKEPGDFANTPNWLYRYSGALDSTKSYQLIVIKNNDTIVRNLPDRNDNSKGVKLVQRIKTTLPYSGYQMSLKKNNLDSRLTWTVEPSDNAAIYDLTVRFYYKEFRNSDNTLLKDTFIDMPFFRSLTPDATKKIQDVYVSSDNLLGSLARSLEASDNVYREFNLQKGMQFKLSAAGKEYGLFTASKQAQGGVASNEALPPYTNIENGVGLLSSRSIRQIDSVTLSVIGFDSLSCSEVTRALRFKNKNGTLCK